MSKASEWAGRLNAAVRELDSARAARPVFSLWEPIALDVEACINENGTEMTLTAKRPGATITLEEETALRLARWILSILGDES